MRITKLKVKEGRVRIEYEQPAVVGWDKYSLDCSESPRAQMYACLLNLCPHVIEMCELPEGYLDKITVSGVSFSYGGEREVMGACLIATMKLDNSNCDLNLVTPHKASESYSEGPADEKQLLSDKCIEALEDIIAECDAYIQGDRAQGKLFAEEAA